jgi:hypothetical protein
MDNIRRAAGDAEPGLAGGARRLAISVVLDGRLDAGRAAEVARLVGRLGLDGVWCRLPPLTGAGPADLPALLRELSAAQVRPGLIVDTDLPDAELADLVAAGMIRLARPGAGPDAIVVPLAADRDLDRAVAEAAAQAAGRPVLVEVPISVGRTAAEAHARADSEELFTRAGHPARTGLFGTLEECQAGAARLAHAGATELVCYLPHSGDLIDVLAQLRAIAVGAGVLRPGEPPSSPPPPPDGWGGRRPSS